MVITQGQDVPMLLQLIKGDAEFLTTATVVYSIYDTDGTTKVVEEQETTYDSILGGYFDDLDVSTNWGNQGSGNYLLVWSISNADGFPETQVENVAVMPGMVDSTVDFSQALAIILSAVAGKSTGFGTKNVAFRDVADSKDRITAVLDKRGNRTSMTHDGS